MLTRGGRAAPAVRLRLGAVPHRRAPHATSGRPRPAQLPAGELRGRRCRRSTTPAARCAAPRAPRAAAASTVQVAAAAASPSAPGPLPRRRARTRSAATDARFGAERDGHVHQGQDITAAEGTPVVAPARGHASLGRLPAQGRRPLRRPARRRRQRLRLHAPPRGLDHRRRGRRARRRPGASRRSAAPAPRPARTCTSRSGPTAGTRRKASHADRPAPAAPGVGRDALAFARPAR